MAGTKRSDVFSRRAEQILALLKAAERPLGAYDLAKLLEGNAKPVAPMQVYRALDELMARNTVMRVESQNAYVCTGGLETVETALALLVCSCCGKVEAAPADVAPLIQNLYAQGFKTSAMVMELLGQCAPCSDASTTAV
jgi:Fur family transcriptional regulator, zinc uptake regulator